MQSGFRSYDGYIVSDQQMQEIQKIFAKELDIEVSPSDVLRIVDVFKEHFENNK